MPHAYNKAEFLSVIGIGHKLLEVYGQMVVIELALKDRAQQWRGGHDVPAMITELNISGLNALAVQLSSELAAQHCTDASGNSSIVNKFPDLRYLRHESDFGTGNSTDCGLQRLLSVVQDVIIQLRQEGVTL